MKKIPIILFYLLLTVFYLACSEDSPVGPAPPVVKERGEIISTSRINTYTPEFLKTIIEFSELDLPFEPQLKVDAIKIVYQTIDYHGNKVHASGALFIPQTDAAAPLLSLQHGTVTKRDEAASVDPFSITAGVVGVLAGSIGYISAVPDLLGFGVSQVMHPYVHAAGNNEVILDFLRAVRTYLVENGVSINDQLFLGGYSEGGYLTMALQKEMETNYSEEFSPTAVAPMAGPYDLKFTLDYLLAQGEYEWPAYAAFFLTAYNQIYQWDRLDEFFNVPYAGNMTTLFNGSYTFADINDQLPQNLTSLIHFDFISGYTHGTETEFLAAVNENTLLDWAPVAPVRLIHGDADTAVPYQNAVRALENLENSGATDIELITIAGGTHETAGLPAIIEMIQWFEEMKVTKDKIPISRIAVN
jgi:pimeloyl-ACP methyl ester carboxylesterase